MTDVELYNSLTQNLTSNISSFVSGEKSIKDFNKEIIILVSLLLDIQDNLTKKNKEIKQIQDKELEKIFVKEEKKKKIKLLRRRNDESSDEEINDEDNPLTILINPTLQSYIPLSQISFSFEHKLLNKDENFENDKINSKEENILKFSQSAILPIKNINYNKKLEYESYINLLNEEEKLENYNNKKEKTNFDLISINKILFENQNKNEEEIIFDNNLLYEMQRTLTTSLGGIINNNSNNLNLNDFQRKTSSIKKNYRTDSYNFEYEQFKKDLSISTFTYYNKKMSNLYLRKMLDNYTKIKTISDKTLYCEDKMFLNLTKIYLLKGGISDKKLYEDTLRNLVYKGENCDFESFLNCFLKILRLEDEQLIIKYKFLLYILADENKEEITLNQLKQYCNEILKCKMIYDEDLYNEIRTKIINKYNSLYKGEYQVFSLRNILLILETFFENK